MPLRQTRLPWATQPQESVSVDRGHPLAACLDALWLANSVSPADVIGGRPSTGAPAAVALAPRERGLAIVGSTASGTNFAIPPVTGYPYVVVAHGAVGVNNGWQFFGQTGSGGLANVSVSAGGQVQFQPRRNFGTTRTLSSAASYPVGTPLCIVVQVFSDTDYRLYVNGAQTNGTLSFGTAGTWLTAMSPIGASLSGHVYLVGYGSGRGALSDAQALAISASPALLWGMLEPQGIAVPAAIAAGTVAGLTMNSAGQLIYNGAAPAGDRKVYLTAAGALLGKTAPGAGDRLVTLSGGALIAG